MTKSFLPKVTCWLFSKNSLPGGSAICPFSEWAPPGWSHQVSRQPCPAPSLAVTLAFPRLCPLSTPVSTLQLTRRSSPPHTWDTGQLMLLNDSVTRRSRHWASCRGLKVVENAPGLAGLGERRPSSEQGGFPRGKQTHPQRSPLAPCLQGPPGFKLTAWRPKSFPTPRAS